MNATEILREVVAIPTPSARSNLPLLRWVSSFLKERGWQVALQRYDDDAGVEKANLIAWPGSGSLPERVPLAFVCHSDTVPYAASWEGALRLEEREGQLHGCGACDVKGSLACFLAAAARLGSGVDGGVVLMVTADEEVGCRGMERLLADAPLRVGSALVSEPTSLRPGIAGKGYGLARVTVEGREAHSAFPGQGVSAISIAARLIVAIEDGFSAGRGAKPVDSLFDPPWTSLNIGVIEGGTAKNIVAGRCSFLVEWRAIPGEDPGVTLGWLEALAGQQSHVDATISVEGLRAEPGFAPAAEGRLQLRLAELLGTEPTGISFGSEASRVARMADEVIVIGPGDMQTAHSDRECVPVAELERWTDVLVELLRG